jgi:hypothetical protein
LVLTSKIVTDLTLAGLIRVISYRPPRLAPYPHAEGMYGGLISRLDEPGEGAAHGRGARQAEHGHRGEVGLNEYAGSGERAVAHGGEVVEVEVASARDVELDLRATQLFILHLELDLVNPQLLHRAVEERGRGWLDRVLPGRFIVQALFGPLAEAVARLVGEQGPLFRWNFAGLLCSAHVLPSHQPANPP